jgi:hypothetical protein
VKPAFSLPLYSNRLRYGILARLVDLYALIEAVASNSAISIIATISLVIVDKLPSLGSVIFSVVAMVGSIWVGFKAVIEVPKTIEEAEKRLSQAKDRLKQALTAEAVVLPEKGLPDPDNDPDPSSPRPPSGPLRRKGKTVFNHTRPDGSVATFTVRDRDGPHSLVASPIRSVWNMSVATERLGCWVAALRLHEAPDQADDKARPHLVLGKNADVIIDLLLLGICLVELELRRGLSVYLGKVMKPTVIVYAHARSRFTDKANRAAASEIRRTIAAWTNGHIRITDLVMSERALSPADTGTGMIRDHHNPATTYAASLARYLRQMRAANTELPGPNASDMAVTALETDNAGLLGIAWLDRLFFGITGAGRRCFAVITTGIVYVVREITGEIDRRFDALINFAAAELLSDRRALAAR